MSAGINNQKKDVQDNRETMLYDVEMMPMRNRQQNWRL